MPDLITHQFDTIEQAADGCYVIVGANAHQYAAPSIAELAGIPFVSSPKGEDMAFGQFEPWRSHTGLELEVRGGATRSPP